MKKEVSCINSRAILDYVKDQSRESYAALLENLDPEIDGLPYPENFLRDPNNWISCTVATTLYRRARRLLNDDMAAYKIARHALENTTMGYAQRILLKAFGSETAALRQAQKMNDKWNRNKRVELVDLQKNEGVVRLHWNEHMDITKDLCLMNRGTYTFVPTIWGGKPTELTETCCYFDGAPYCEYHISWPKRNRIYEIFHRIFMRKSVLMETISEMERDKKIIEEKYEEVNRLNQALNHKIKQLLAIQDIGKAILSVLDLDVLLRLIMDNLYSACQINRAIIMIVNREAGCLEYVHGVGFKGDVPEMIKSYRVPLGRVNNIISRVAGTGVPEYIPEVSRSGLRKENLILSYAHPASVFVVPLITRSKVIGVIATDAVDESGIPRETRKILEVFAPQIAIAIQNARLYRKLQEQMEELKKSHALLKRAEKLSFLGNLAARLAHEIKNPMTAIGTFLQMLPTKYEDEEFRKDFYAIAMEETTRINSLLTELLNLTKTRESHFRATDLHQLIRSMILLISPQTKSKKIRLTQRFDPEIGMAWMDPEKIKEVILNILSNAVEFTPENGDIQVTTARQATNGGRPLVRIEIRDSGPGIDPSITDKIFDPYFTTKHKSDMHNGTGLGLFISHQNMQDHGGSIEVAANGDSGTLFILTLPLSENGRTAPPAGPAVKR